MAGEDNQDRTSGSGASCGETRRSWVQIPPVPRKDLVRTRVLVLSTELRIEESPQMTIDSP